jgi:exodeoxyribonuclease V gamma subunit
VAPGAEGRAQVGALLEEIAPFAELALQAGFGDNATRRAFEHDADAGALRGTLDHVHRPGVLRVVLRPDGLHGGHAIRHGLDALCASLLGLAVHELARPSKDDPPAWRVRKPVKPARAAAALDALFAWQDAATRSPLPFLPKSGHAFVRCLVEKDGDAALRAARDQWMGSQFNADRAEATAATRMALRGRDPFLDEDTAAQMRFAQLSVALFQALDEARPLDPAVLA